jgi:hypothetical protein
MSSEPNVLFEDRLADFIRGYKDVVTRGFDDRLSKSKLEIYDKSISEVIGALMARQATLSIEMAAAPTTWNGHVAPLFLRCMVDAYITFAWILVDPKVRSMNYIEYGLGQEKLFVAYLEEALEQEPDMYDADSMKEMIEVRRGWLNAQLAEWATEVNVGSWSGMSTREMAKEIGRESIYRFSYVPFSGAAHNMWQHIGIYNAEPCVNPLHKWHVLPVIRRAPADPDFMYRAAKYLSITYELFDEKTGIQSEVQLPYDYFVGHELFCRSSEDEVSSE